MILMSSAWYYTTQSISLSISEKSHLMKLFLEVLGRDFTVEAHAINTFRTGSSYFPHLFYQ